MPPKNLRMTMDRVKRATDVIRSLGADRVLVGIPAENAFRKPEPGEKAAPTNAALGYIHENGSPARNIPARPFLIPGIQEARESIADRLEGSVRKILADGGGDPEVVLHSVGILAQNAVRAKITAGPFVPLAPKTVAKRRAKGRTGTKPLIDTGQLRNSVTYVVRGRK